MHITECFTYTSLTFSVRALDGINRHETNFATRVPLSDSWNILLNLLVFS